MDVTFTIRRYQPEVREEPYYEDFEFEAEPTGADEAQAEHEGADRPVDMGRRRLVGRESARA